MSGREILIEEIEYMREALTTWDEDELLLELIYRAASGSLGRAAMTAMTRQLRKVGFFRVVSKAERDRRGWLGSPPWKRVGKDYLEHDDAWQMQGTVEDLLNL